MKELRIKILNEILKLNIHNINLKKGIVISKRTNKKIGSIDNHGYLTTTLTLNNKNYRYRIHEIIALRGGFDILNPKTINHIDGNKLNNSIDNLESITLKENIIHAHGNNLSINPIAYGEFTSKAKLTLKDVEDIKRKYNSGYKMRHLAKQYNVVHSTIHNIIYKKSWVMGNVNYKEAMNIHKNKHKSELM